MSNSQLQTAEAPRVKQKLTASEIFVEYGAAIALAALILFNIIFTKNFLSVNTLFTIIKQSTPILFTTIGMTIVISAGGTDISAGSMMGFCGIICALSLSAGMNFYLAVLLALVLCALIGIFNGLLIAKAGVQPIILTLVMQIVMRGVTVMLADSKVFPMNSYPEVKTLGLGRLAGGVPIQAIFFCVAAILGLFLINRTTLGKYVEAIGGSERAARLAGIRTVLIIVTVYTLSAVFAGMGGMLILRLLEEKREVTDGLEELVLSPQQDIPAVRKGVEALGFGIIEEKMLKEDGKYYVIIHCRRGAVPYTKHIDYLYGGKLLEEKNLVLLAFLREEEKRVHTIARRLKAAQTPKAQERLREVEQESIWIQEAVACLQH